MADPRPIERALGLRTQRVAAAAAAAVPTSHAEEQPTRVPTPRATAVPPKPTSIAVLARHEDEDADHGAMARALVEPGSGGEHEFEGENDNADGPQVALRPNGGNAGQGNTRGLAPAVGERGSGQSRGQDGQGEAGPPRVAREDGNRAVTERDRDGDAVAVQRVSEQPASADRGGDENRRGSDNGTGQQGDDRGRGQNNQPAVEWATPAPALPATEAHSPGRSEFGISGNGGNTGNVGGDGGAVRQTPGQQVAPVDDRAARPASSTGTTTTNSTASGQGRPAPTATPTTVRKPGGDGKQGDTKTIQSPSDDLHKNNEGGDD
jgi:hypothetical protein